MINRRGVPLCCTAVIDAAILVVLIRLFSDDEPKYGIAFIAAFAIGLFNYLLLEYVLVPMGTVAILLSVIPFALVGAGVVWIVQEVSVKQALIIGGILAGYKFVLLILLIMFVIAAGAA